MKTYTVTTQFTVDEHTDEHLQTPQAIEAEFISWLTDLKAIVVRVEVQK